MTAKELKEEGLIESHRGLVYMFTPDELEALIATAIAEHEQAKWKAYPENKPEPDKWYLVHNADGDVSKCHGMSGWDLFAISRKVIAFRELPKPYKP